MNIGNKPELLDRLAAGYALGTLRGGARRRLEQYAKQSASVRTSLILWQERMVAMTELSNPIQPSPSLWPRIEKSLQQQIAKDSAVATLNQVVIRARNWWRNLALGCAVATVGAVVFGVSQLLRITTLDQSNAQLQAQITAVPKLQYVAVLSDEKSNATILVTVDSTNNQIAVQRVSGFKEASGKSLQLWSIPKTGGPTSVSILDGDKMVKVKVASALMENTAVMAVSLEEKGGVPSEKGPQGPVLFKGAMLPASM
jgi:anti-sigma-K factor RskA